MDSGSWLPMYGDGWFATLAEFDTWESGFDFSDAPTTFDETAAARVSCTPLTTSERAAAMASLRDIIKRESRSYTARWADMWSVEDQRLADAWRLHDEIILDGHKREWQRQKP